MEIKEYTFYQDPDTRWYVDIPEWEGEKADLEMVAGADIMLNYMAEGSDKVRLMFSEEPQENFDTLVLQFETPEVGGGYYYMGTYNGIEIKQAMWLCDVTKYVFGKMPETIYVKKIEY